MLTLFLCKPNTVQYRYYKYKLYNKLSNKSHTELYIYLFNDLLHKAKIKKKKEREKNW